MADLEDDVFLEASDDADHRTLSLTRTPTVLLVFAANRFTRSAARLYGKRYGIGAMDWRMLVMLTKEPDIPVTRASQTIGIDKAAVSRSLSRLEHKGLAVSSTPKGDARRKLWRLTRQGHALHNTILKVALGRQKRMLAGFTPEEVETFNDLLRRFMTNLEKLDASGGHATFT